MVLRQRARQLRCHRCDHRESSPFKCPDCCNEDLIVVGRVTQRVSETLRAFLPTAAVVRVDRDSTAHKTDWADLYRRIADNEIDILVGTQMLAKGHDFARLNLVIVFERRRQPVQRGLSRPGKAVRRADAGVRQGGACRQTRKVLICT